MSPDILHGWPAPIREHLESRGALLELRTLSGGMSGSRVYRAGFASGTVIVKAETHLRELAFYQDCAPPLQDRLRTPRLYASSHHERACWLALEDVPTPLPRERWLADPVLIASLSALHDSDCRVNDTLAFRPSWTRATTERALSCFTEAVQADLGPLLEPLRVESQPLFEPHHAISGDPNPMNWGVLTDGRPVLYDWGRLGLGTAALDLAITVPGLGEARDFERVARAYLTLRGDPADVTRLARGIAVAKAWSIVEYLREVGNQPAGGVARLESLMRPIPDWLCGFPRG